MARWGVSGDPGGVDAAVSHRRLLPSSPYLLPLQDGALFERIGGQATIDRLVDSLYDRFQADAVIRPFFGGDLRNSRNRQKRFFSEWLGGAPRYSESAWGGLYQHHEDLRITPAVAERWLQHLSAALVDAVPDGDDAARILERAHAVARMLVNSDDEPQSSTGMPRHRSERAASCGVGARTVKQAGLLAQRDKVEELAALVAEISELLLDHGVDARAVGAGCWVLDPQIAPMLARAGASAGVGTSGEDSGDWVRMSCTGNQSRKDDPAYVAALLRYGARVDQRYNGATPLHYASKAGFLQTMRVLLENGADTKALDDRGRIPLDWLDQAAKSVDRDAVRSALTGAAVPA